MSRTRIVKGKIYEFAEEHFSYFSEASIVESSAINYAENSETTIRYGANPDKAPSSDLVNYYVKVRIGDPTHYKGEFGFDWIDINPATEDIEKIQDVEFSNVEYFYKKPTNPNDLGDIIAKSTDEQGAKDAIKEHYKFSDFLKPCTDGKIDRPFILIKPSSDLSKPTEISLSLEVNIPNGGTLADEKIYLTDDDFYSFEMAGDTKAPSATRTEMKVSSDKQVIELKIKCLKESPSEKKYTIYQENLTTKGTPVGGFVMMENKVLKLKFRVIALVSSDSSPAAKAQALFQKFKDNGIKKYLNENSLNQAGYEVEIENQAMFDTLGSGDLDDYFYAFDKTDWTNKKYFANINKQKYDIDPSTGYCKPGSIDASGNCMKVPTPTDVIVDNQKDLGLPDKANEIDTITITEYKNKLKGKGKTYEGGIIILSDFESSGEEGAFSRTYPLDYYAIFVFSSNSSDKPTYAHEIGHMLGLEHTFITIDTSINKDDKKKYRDKKKQINDSITDNITPTKLIIRSEKSSNQGKALGKQSKYITTFINGYNGIRKTTLLTCIDNSNNYFEARIRDYTVQINAVNNNTICTMPKKGEDGKWILNPDGKPKQFPTTPTLFKERLKEQKGDFEKYKRNNIASKSKLQSILSDNKYIEFDNEFDLVPEDSLKIYEDYLKKLMQEWQQMISNYLYFKQNSTKNIMDYTPPEYDAKAGKNVAQRIRFLNHQILIMRKDYENY